MRGPANLSRLPRRLAVAATLRCTTAAATTRTASAASATATLLSTGRTVATLRSGGASRRGHRLFHTFGLFTFLGLIGVKLIVDLDVIGFVVVIEIGSAFQSDGALWRRTFGALGTRGALRPFRTLAAISSVLTISAILTVAPIAAFLAAAAAG